MRLVISACHLAGSQRETNSSILEITEEDLEALNVKRGHRRVRACFPPDKLPVLMSSYRSYSVKLPRSRVRFTPSHVRSAHLKIEISAQAFPPSNPFSSPKSPSVSVPPPLPRVPVPFPIPRPRPARTLPPRGRSTKRIVIPSSLLGQSRSVQRMVRLLSVTLLMGAPC